MRLVKPKFEIINRDNTIYLKSKTVFINRYIHPEDGEEEEYNPLERYCLNKHSKVKDDGDNYYITTSIEVLVENGWESDLKYICDPTKYHEKRLTVKFICSNNFYNLLTSKYWYIVRNFSINKNPETGAKDNELTFIIPHWLPNIKLEGKYVWNCFFGIDTYGPSKECYNSREEYLRRKDSDFLESSPEGLFILSLLNFEFTYKELMKIKPVKVTCGILPNSLKIELLISGFESDWKKLFNVVKDEELKELLDPLEEEFIKNN